MELKWRLNIHGLKIKKILKYWLTTIIQDIMEEDQLTPKMLFFKFVTDDSYYTSIHLARKLEEKGFGISGSISNNRKAMPKIDYDKIEKYAIRILSQRMKKSDLSIIIWRDDKIQRLITNIQETNRTTDVERTDCTKDNSSSKDAFSHFWIQ